MSVAFILNPGYNTINNVHHTFWNIDEDNIKNESLNQALEVSTSVKAPIHVVGTTHTISSTAGGIITDAPQFEIPIVISSQVNTDTLLPNLSTTGISVQADLVLDSTNISGVNELTCGTLHYTTLDPAVTPGDPSTWSQYPATSNVDLNNNRLVNTGSNDVEIRTQTLKVQNSGGPSASTLSQLLVYAQSDNAASTTQLQFYTGDSVTAISEITQYSKNAVADQYIGFGTDSSGFRLSGAAADVAITTSNQFQPNTGKIRLCYNQGLAALTLNQAGAVSFNSDWVSGIPVDGDYGTSGQLIQSNGSSAPPSWVAAPSASNWSTFDATSDVDLHGYALSDSTRGSVYVNQSITALSSVDNGNSAFGNSVNNSNTTTSLVVVTNNGKAGNRTGSITSVPSNKTGASGYYENPGSVSVGSDGGDLQLQTYGTGKIRLVYDNFAKAITVNQSGAMSFNSTFAAGAPVDGSFGTAGQIVQSNGSSAPPSWIASPISGRYVLYVATDGLDTNAGDITHPKLTIQSAINAATALYPQQVVILIQPGVYSGALSITRPNITLLGLSPSSQQNLLTQIAGNISIACTASQDLYYSQVCIANLLVSGSIIDTSSVVHTLNIEACRIATTGQVFAQTSSADNRTRLVKCTLLQAALTADVNPMMLFSSGSILLNQLDVTAKNNCNLVKFNGTATLPTCALCTFTSDSASTVAEPIVLLAPTNGANKPFTFGYNAFIYSSYAPKLSHPESAGICVSSGTGRPYITVAYNSFALAGTDATNYAIYDTGYNTSTAGYYFYFSNNGGVNPAGINAVIPVLVDFAPQAHHIYGFAGGGSQNKFTLSAVA